MHPTSVPSSAAERRSFVYAILSAFLTLFWMLPAPAAADDPHDETCRPAAGSDADVLIDKMNTTLGVSHIEGRILHFTSAENVQQSFQSERTYPPFFSLMRTSKVWYDPATGTEHAESESIYPGYGPFEGPAVVQDARGAFLVRDTTLMPAPAGMGADALYTLNPWAVAADWSDAQGVRIVEECRFREFWRTVLERPGRHGPERLYVDEKTGFPVKLDATEPHYLWGQVRIETLYSLWEDFEGAHFPRAAFRVRDGVLAISRTVGAVEFVAAADVPALNLPPEREPAGSDVPRFLQALPPDTVAVSKNVYLLRNVGYTEAFALVGDTVFVFDATQGEDRARQDHEWIRRLIPGEHPVAVVVTDLAWPHIAGVRYWVAQGATIISHRISEDFLRRVVERRWTLNPDLLEHRRTTAELRFIGIDGARTFGGGTLRLAPIDGIGSEGALIAYLPEARFLWASDFIQMLDRPTSYASEVWAAARRYGFDPIRVAAQHLPLSDWSDVEALQTGR